MDPLVLYRSAGLLGLPAGRLPVLKQDVVVVRVARRDEAVVQQKVVVAALAVGERELLPLR
jgi:hypothetical protein